VSKIRLVYAQNVIERNVGRATQRLVFLIRVANLAFEKHVDVVWAGENGVWHELPARFQVEAADNEEYWLAATELPLTAEGPLPGNVQFALRYRVQGKEYWDNNDGRDHTLQADSGVVLAWGTPLSSGALKRRSVDGSMVLPVSVAVDSRVGARGVTVHWSTDDWQTTRTTPCRLRTDFWDAEFRSNARNPNHYGVQIWDAQLQLQRARGARYRVACETASQTLWDDYANRRYSLRPALLRVLALNLHCYQEPDQQHKFLLIARAIDELHVDIVCLQEVAENWNDGAGDWGSNSARIINQHLPRPYNLATDWSHLGFGRYREGVAVLSRHPILRQESRYVSASRDPYDIHARRAVLAQLNVPSFGRINVFSTHLSWWKDGFAEQFGNLRDWARDAHTRHVKASLLCGDFNAEAGSRGYELVLDSGEYDDTFLAATRPHEFTEIFRRRTPNWRDHLRDDRRIDYLFMRRASSLRVESAREVFTERDFGRVSDHIGYMVTFAAK
jgi:maltose 6'-phosphate phosphatase